MNKNGSSHFKQLQEGYIRVFPVTHLLGDQQESNDWWHCATFRTATILAGSPSARKSHLLRRIVPMSFILPILLALLTKPFLRSRLCQGQYGFSATYFGWGFLGTIALSFGVFWLLGPIFFEQDHGRGDRTLSVTFRIWSLITTLYMAGIAVGLNQIRKATTSPLLNLYIVMLIVCTVLLLLVSLAAATVYWIIYAVAAVVVYKISARVDATASES